MRGKDFTHISDVLTDKAVSCLETRGADSVMVHNSLNKMYFEAIWNLNGVRSKIDMEARQLGITESESLQFFHQMLFDIVSFYDLGNAAQLFQNITGKWSYSNVFFKSHSFNNQNLSAVIYLLYFLREKEALTGNQTEIKHVMYLNSAIFMTGRMKFSRFVQYLKDMSANMEHFTAFYHYASKMCDDFYQYDCISATEFTVFMKEETEYFLSLDQEKLDLVYHYLCHIGTMVEECKLCADRQNNFGLTETEFDDVLASVI